MPLNGTMRNIVPIYVWLEMALVADTIIIVSLKNVELQNVILNCNSDELRFVELLFCN